MGFLNSHPYTAVTSIINDCCENGDTHSTDDVYMQSQLSSLIEAIYHQKDFTEPGPIEAARAIRKKLKHGTINEQFNALKMLDLLVINSIDDKKMAPLFNDDKLLDRLQVILTNDDSYNQKVDKKIFKLASSMMRNWYSEFGDSYQNLNNIILVYKRCSKNKNFKRKVNSNSFDDDFADDNDDDAFQEGSSSAFTRQTNSNSRYSRATTRDTVPDFMNDEADMDDDFDDYDLEDDYDDSSYKRKATTIKPKTNEELDRKFKIPKINYEKEAPKILHLIAQANILSTNLINSLDSLKPDELAIHNIKANDAFDDCRAIRRKVLTYLQLVHREELLGPLLKCNDDLVTALKKYESKSAVPKNNIVESSSDDEDEGPMKGSRRVPENDISESDDGDKDEDDDYDDASTAYIKEEEQQPPVSRKVSKTNSSSSTLVNTKRAQPPPIPPKNSNLRSPKVAVMPTIQQQQQQQQQPVIKARSAISDYDPFSDDNEVAPARW